MLQLVNLENIEFGKMTGFHLGCTRARMKFLSNEESKHWDGLAALKLTRLFLKIRL
jgi:hypothetical protein